MLYKWLKALHIVFMVSWFAGLFYLPRLFVYHAMTDDTPGRERFKVMERKLFGLMTLAAVLTAVFGIAMLVYARGLLALPWLQLKLTLVAGLIVYHVWCGRIVAAYRADRMHRSHVWFRWFNEAPVLGLLGIVLLAVVKPMWQWSGG